MATSLRKLFLFALLLLSLPLAVIAQFTYTTNDGAITITKYTGINGGSVTIPSSTNGLPVTDLGRYSFYFYTLMTNVTIPDSVTNIGDYAFFECTGLAKVTFGNNMIGIGYGAFDHCGSLVSVTIPRSVIVIGSFAFYNCAKLSSVFFAGDKPIFDNSLLQYSTNAVIYYLPGATGWGPGHYDRQPVLWNPSFQTSDASFGVQAGGFGLPIMGTPNIPIVVEACTNLINAAWTPLQSCTLTNGLLYVADLAWTNYPNRTYRIRSP